MKSMRRAKWMLGIVAVGLFLSAVTIWPALPELKAAQHLVWGDGQPTGTIGTFVAEVIKGLEQTSKDFPFLFYAGDWLAFTHIMLAILFLGAMRDPIRNKWIVQCGLLMCVLIFVLAGVCIPVRGLPLVWFFVDAAFGLVAGVLLGIAYADIRQAEKAAAEHATPEVAAE